MNVYHMFLGDEPLRDNILYPLSDLKTKHPDIYESNMLKYNGRQHILQQRFPYLDCSWEEVIFLSPVHPDKVTSALAQYFRRVIPSIPYHAIPLADLSTSNLVLWLFRTRVYDPAEVVLMGEARIEQYMEIPEATTAYFQEQNSKGERPLFFMHIPHVLHKGLIDVRAYPLQYTQSCDS